MTDLGNNLIAVSVPEEAENFDYERDNIFYDLPNGILERSINIGGSILDNYEILGTVTALDIDFDVHPYCEVCETDNLQYKKFPEGSTYFNKVAFRSILSSKGLHFENPYGKKANAWREECEEWQQAENNLVQKLIILKRL